jgi:hypothetical protein
VTAVRLRDWRGVKPVAGPAGAAITTRLRVTPADAAMLDTVAGHLGRLRRADLVQVCRPALQMAQARREGGTHAVMGLNARKRALTALSSARWANAVIAVNDAQYRSSREAQGRQVPRLAPPGQS